jgi:colanic acid/amylovoran biosynthesis protein
LGLGADRIAVAADSAFAFAETCQGGPPNPRHNGPLRVAISVRDWPHFERQSGESGMAAYVDAVAGLVRHLIDEYAAAIVFISTCQGVREYWTDDSLVAERVRDRLPPAMRTLVSIDRQFHRPEQLLECLAQHDIVVATRLHVAILALCAGIPVVPIVYEFKTRELFTRMDPDYPLQDIETLNADGLASAFRSVYARYDELRRAIKNWVAAECERALSAGPIVARAVPAHP